MFNKAKSYSFSTLNFSGITHVAELNFSQIMYGNYVPESFHRFLIINGRLSKTYLKNMCITSKTSLQRKSRTESERHVKFLIKGNESNSYKSKSKKKILTNFRWEAEGK